VDFERLLAHSEWLTDLARQLVRDASFADDLCTTRGTRRCALRLGRSPAIADGWRLCSPTLLALAQADSPMSQAPGLFVDRWRFRASPS
jgi:hypothetical protein